MQREKILVAIWKATTIGEDHIPQMADCRPRWQKENLIYCPVLVDHYILSKTLYLVSWVLEIITATGALVDNIQSA